MGKTRLLEAIPEEMLPMCSNKDRCQWGGIFDLYHTDLHTNSGIEAAIIKALAPESFTEYRARRGEYENLRSAGGDPKRLEELREELRALFVQGFNENAVQIRPIFCFDTVELVQYESDAVQEVCGIEPHGIEVRGWLTTVIPQLKNAVIILAGRPRKMLRQEKDKLWDELKEKLAPAFETTLSGFWEQEIIEYLEALAETARIEDPIVADEIQEYRTAEEVQGNIYRLTGGVPLHLALLVDMLLEGIIVPAHLDSVSLVDVDSSFFAWFNSLRPELAEVLPLVAWARKGMNVELLGLLVPGWSQDRCEAVLEDLKRFAFIKTRPGTDLIFLHDKMCDLMQEYVLHERPVQRREVSRRISEYYDKRIQALPTEREALTVEQLYYYLLGDERIGYQRYTRLSEEALTDQWLDSEMGLRDELLRFFRERHRETPDYISRDSAVRWVRRYIAMGDYPTALKVAEGIRSSGHALFKGFEPDDTKDPFFAAALLTYQGEALAYLGRNRDAISTLQRAISLLEPISADDDYQSWNKAHVLGRAYNNLGYVYSREMRFTDAVREYDQALEYFDKADITSLEADTLKNKAMVLSRQGKLLQARALAKDAEDIFHSLSMRYGEALTLNTRGLIVLQTQEWQEAEPLCKEALQIFTNLDDARGVGLASIGLGWALRKKGGLAPRHSEEVDESFKEAETLLGRAIDIFTREVREPTRLIEAYSQLGRVYRDQVNLYREMGVGKPEEIGKLEQLAEQNLTRSIELAKQLNLQIEQADCLEDIAEIYLGREQYSKAEKLLEQSDELIPAEYKITQERGLPSLEQADSVLWFMLGKNHLLGGRIALAQEQYEKAMESNLLAYLYLELYSIETIDERYTGWSSGSGRILDQLRRLSRETLEHLQDYIKRVAEEYGVSGTRGLDKTLRLLTDALQLVGPGGQVGERRRE